MNGFWDAIAPAVSWFADRWAVDAAPPAWAVTAAAVVIAVTLLVRPTWLLARGAVTIVHEMGHAVVAKLFGRSISGIRVHSDTSGLAITYGKPGGFGVLMMSLAGYTAPAVVGAGLVWAAFAGYAGASVLLLFVLLALAFLLVRNVWGGLVTAASVFGVGWILWNGIPEHITALALVAGLFLATGSVRAAFDLFRAHARGAGGESDAVMAARNSLLPTFAWTVFFLVVTIACAVQAISVTIATLV